MRAQHDEKSRHEAETHEFILMRRSERVCLLPPPPPPAYPQRNDRKTAETPQNNQAPCGGTSNKKTPISPQDGPVTFYFPLKQPQKAYPFLLTSCFTRPAEVAAMFLTKLKQVTEERRFHARWRTGRPFDFQVTGGFKHHLLVPKVSFLGKWL